MITTGNYIGTNKEQLGKTITFTHSEKLTRERKKNQEYKNTHYRISGKYKKASKKDCKGVFTKNTSLFPHSTFLYCFIYFLLLIPVCNIGSCASQVFVADLHVAIVSESHCVL